MMATCRKCGLIFPAETDDDFNEIGRHLWYMHGVDSCKASDTEIAAIIDFKKTKKGRS